MSAPFVSVVIVSWNTRDLLRNCVISIRKETTIPIEVIVVDNNSSDASQVMVGAEFPWAKLIANDRNLGFAAANNQGIRVASGELVLLLNPDTVILDGAIDRCAELLKQRPDIACLGCQVWEDSQTIQRTCFKFPSLSNDLLTAFGTERLFKRSRLLGGPLMPWWDRCSEREVDVVSGMFMMVRRRVLDAVGLLDEAYFVYGEEADLCFQMHRRGFKRYFSPTARILHVEGGGKSTSQQSVAMYVQLQRSMLVFHRKNYGLLAESCLRAIYAPRMLLRAGAGVLRMLAGNRDTGRHIVSQSLAALTLQTTESVRPLLYSRKSA